MEEYGGITFDHLWTLEFWRLFASQLIHVKQFHMIFNVLSFVLLGVMLEKYLGFTRFFVLWFVSGVMGTLISTLFVEPPWNLGTGASQAIMGVAGFGILLLWKKINTTKDLKVIIAFAIVPALTLDLIYAHYPKPGHVVGFVIGLAIGFYYLNRKQVRLEWNRARKW